jgi:hypothetical protein
MKPTVGQVVTASSRCLIFAGSIWGGATSCPAQTPVTTPAVAPDDIVFAQLEVGVDSPIKKSGVLVIKDQDQWKEFLTKMNELTVKRPKIDWTKFQIVVATLEGSQNSGITLHVSKVHPNKNGKKTDIEFVLDQQEGNSRLINTTNSDNYLGKTLYPYAILQTPRINTKWNIKVDE